MLVAPVGLYAVITHSMSQRIWEIGVRNAIGATPKHISQMVLGAGLRPVSIGLIAGFAASLAVNRILRSQLVGIFPWDPVAIFTAPMVLILIALLACQPPARRATTAVDPAIAVATISPGELPAD
jgi:ABC-type antimicrobial peptide transport system permease subunit